jgi:cell shape-determining protein MreD
MRGAVAILVSLYVLRALVAEVNSALAGLHIWLFAGGLFVAYSALTMPFGQGFTVSILGGLLCDSVTPVAFGTHSILFAAAHAVVYNVRERLQRDETMVRVSVALLVNLALFLTLSFIRIRLSHGASAAWPRVLSDLAWSEISVALAAPWFFSLQLRALEMARANPSRAA